MRQWVIQEKDFRGARYNRMNWMRWWMLIMGAWRLIVFAAPVSLHAAEHETGPVTMNTGVMNNPAINGNTGSSQYGRPFGDALSSLDPASLVFVEIINPNQKLAPICTSADGSWHYKIVKSGTDGYWDCENSPDCPYSPCVITSFSPDQTGDPMFYYWWNTGFLPKGHYYWMGYIRVLQCSNRVWKEVVWNGGFFNYDPRSGDQSAVPGGACSNPLPNTDVADPGDKDPCNHTSVD